MEPRPILPLLVSNGTLTEPRDMARALETVESFTYRYVVDGDEISAGKATLVRIMIDPESSSVLVNGCLFMNTLSLKYLNFSTDETGTTTFALHAEGSILEITPLDDPESRPARRHVIRIMEEDVFGMDSYVGLDDEDEE